MLEGVEKHVVDMVSQQFVPPPVTAGQLFWQSLSCEQLVAHAVPPPPDPLPDDEPPPDEEL